MYEMIIYDKNKIPAEDKKYYDLINSLQIEIRLGKIFLIF